MNRKPRIAFAVLSAALLYAASLLAQIATPPYIAEMPSVERVMQAMQTSDPDETAARQMAAFTHLKNMIEKLAGPRFPKNQLTPEETKLRQAYYTAYWNISQAKPQYKSFTAMRGLDIDIKFRDEVIQKCFPPSFAAEYSKFTGQAIAQNEAFHKGAEEARGREAAKQQVEGQKAYNKLQADYDAKRIPAAQTPEQRALNRCITAGRLPASCMGNTLLGGFTQMIGQVLPSLAKQPAPGPVMAGVFQGAGNWRIDFITDGVLINCSFLSPNQETYSVQFKNGQTLIVVNTTPKPLVLTITPAGNLVAPGPVEIDGVIASGYHEGPTNAMYKDVAGNLYDSNGNKAFQGAGYSTFSPKRTTCPALNLSTKGASVGIETMQTDVLKMAFGGDKGAPTPPGVRMRGVYNAKTGFSVEFYPESAIVACGEPARAYPYEVVANGSQTAVKIEDPSHPLLLNFEAGGALDPGSGSYLVHGRRITGQNDDGDFTFAPLEATCNLDALLPNAPAVSAPATASATPSSGNTTKQPAGPPMAVPGKPTGDAVLSIHSGFPNAPNTPNALANTPLILLRDTLSNILLNTGIQVAAGVSPQMAIATACHERSADCQTMNQALLAYASAGARSDASGNGTLPGVPPGTYYLMISGHSNNQGLYWDLKVELKSGANAITLDEHNGKLLSAGPTAAAPAS